MRPLRVEFQAFGPYAGKEVVDFESISSQGLFLICGKTGKGKTMILDAMTYALYGKSSGSGRDNFENMRCTNADPATATYVRFEFENHGDIYLFERRIERKIKNYATSYSMMKKDENGQWQVLAENPREKDLNTRAAELIGLDYDQFCQVIILPQGEFEKLLTSKSSEKEAILTSIFGENKWQEIAGIFYEEADERKSSLKGIKDRIDSSLAEEECATVEELSDLIANKKKESDTLDEEYKKADHDKVIEKMNGMLAIAARFGDLHKTGEKIRSFEEMKDQRAQWEKQLDDAKRAEKIRVLLDALLAANEMLKKRREAEAGARSAAAELQKKSEDATKALNEHIAREKEVEEKKALKIRYEGKRSDYENLDKAEGELKNSKEAVEKAISEEKKAQEAHAKLTQAVVRLQGEYEALDNEHKALLDDYLAGITGILARDLEEGKPCPVCGSIEHPHKAHVSDKAVSKEMVDAKEDERNKKYSELNDNIALQDQAKKALDDKKAASQEAGRKAAVAETTLNNLKENLVEGIDSLKVLDETIASLGESIRLYDETKSKLEEESKSSKEALSAANSKTEVALGEVKAAEAKSKESEEALEKGLAENKFGSRDEAQNLMMSDEDREALDRKITEFDAGLKTAQDNLKDIKEELKDKTEPDEAECKAKQKEAIDAKTEYSGRKETLRKDIERLTKKLEDLKKEGDGIDDKLREAENDLTFAKKLRGDTGTGLQRYVLGIMFSSVVAAANKMLEKVHGGRYQLFRSDERAQGSNKKGLELKVYDKFSEEDREGRFVNTLSGGEKFLVSLALSIGMSTIAQRSGIRIDALFIDEGFGTLDEESIGDAMNVLNSIQESNGIVGIISHVQILQDQIPSKLRVESAGKGSHIVRSIG